MRKITSALFLASLVLVVLHASGQVRKERTDVYRLDSLDKLETVNTKAEIATYRGKRALHLAPGQIRTRIEAR